MVANSVDNVPVTVDDLGVTGACTALMREAVKPTLMQTLEVRSHCPIVSVVWFSCCGGKAVKLFLLLIKMCIAVARLPVFTFLAYFKIKEENSTKS